VTRPLSEASPSVQNCEKSTRLPHARVRRTRTFPGHVRHVRPRKSAEPPDGHGHTPLGVSECPAADATPSNPRLRKFCEFARRNETAKILRVCLGSGQSPRTPLRRPVGGRQGGRAALTRAAPICGLSVQSIEARRHHRGRATGGTEAGRHRGRAAPRQGGRAAPRQERSRPRPRPRPIETVTAGECGFSAGSFRRGGICGGH
jgi:hypothetical protein